MPTACVGIRCDLRSSLIAFTGNENSMTKGQLKVWHGRHGLSLELLHGRGIAIILHGGLSPAELQTLYPVFVDTCDIHVNLLREACMACWLANSCNHTRKKVT